MAPYNPGPRTVVLAPPAVPQLYGLERSALIASSTPAAFAGSPVNAGERWQNGFAYAPLNCLGEGPIAARGHDSKDIDDNTAVVEYDPILLWAGDKCSPWDRTRDYKARARQLLTADRSRQLAQELWTGTIAQAQGFPNNYFARDDNVDVVTAGAAAPDVALACLERGLTTCSSQRSMIHCTVDVMVAWKEDHLIELNGQVWTTPNGTIVVADQGYPGSGPHGQAATSGHVWAYGTDMVYLRFDDMFVIPDLEAEALDRSVDTFEYRAEQLAAATWSGCCHVAAEVNIVLCTHTGGS